MNAMLRARARLEDLSDRLNPIMIKEVRQAFRGRYFNIVFVLTLTVTTLVGVFVLLVGYREEPDELGVIYFSGIFACLASALMGLIPIQAFVSGGWDTERRELLTLTNLSNRQIVWGKLMSAVGQGGLVALALLPFLALALLLPGVDPLVPAVLVPFTILLGAVLSLLTIAVSSLSSSRLYTALAMAVMGSVQFGLIVGVVGMGIEIADDPGDLHDREIRLALIGLSVGAVLTGAFAFMGAVARLAHPEENRSTNMRIVATLIIFASQAMLYLFARNEQTFVAITFPTATVFSVIALLFVTEPEYLGRRAAHGVPPERWKALLFAPFMPGGGLGALLVTALIAAWSLPVIFFPPPMFGGRVPTDYEKIMFILMMAAMIQLLFPSVLLSRWTRRPGVRAAAVFFVPAFWFVVGSFIAALTAWLRYLSNSIDDDDIFALCLAGLAICLLMNVPRVITGYRRVLEASRANRLRLKGIRENTPPA